MTKRKQTIIVQFHFWPSISKIFEKVVYNQLYRYFTENNLFSDSQYGFRPKQSTELATVELVNIIFQSTDNKELPLAIHRDLFKASERNHFSVSSVIISKNQVRWRKWYTILKKFILTGVTQGCILGPVLFLIYVEWHYVSIRILYFHSVCWWYLISRYSV